MSPTFYSLLHLSSLLLLTGGTFYAFAAKVEERRKVLMATGLLSFLALVGGFGLVAKVYGNTFHAWIWVKLACWLGLSALSGLAFRRREKAPLLLALASVLLVVAVAMVYLKPGM